MLDENLPTFHAHPSQTSPHNTLLTFTHRGSQPTPEFLLRRPDPSFPSAHSKYAVALADPVLADVIYAEVLVTPAHVTATAPDGISNGIGVIQPPDIISMNLYNPDQVVELRQVQGGWGRGMMWEFRMPIASFAQPSASMVDRETAAPAAEDLVPRLTFRWKRDRMSRNMTCYLVGKTNQSISGKKGSKEPDITVALAEGGKSGEGALAVYEPNMNRVEIEDRKGLEILLLLSSEVIKDLWLSPKDPFHLEERGGRDRRKSSKGTTIPVVSQTVPVVAAAAAIPSRKESPTKVHKKTASGRQTQEEINAETERLKKILTQEKIEREKKEWEETEKVQKMLEQEERERKVREERERRDFEAAEKLRKQEEEAERRQREKEVERETLRLQKLYGISSTSQSPPQIQASSSSNHSTPPPSLPPRPVSTGPTPASGSSQYAQYFAAHPQSGYQETSGAGGHTMPGAAGRVQAALQSRLEGLPLAGSAASTMSGLLNKVKQRGEMRKGSSGGRKRSL